MVVDALVIQGDGSGLSPNVQGGRTWYHLSDRNRGNNRAVFTNPRSASNGYIYVFYIQNNLTSSNPHTELFYKYWDGSVWSAETTVYTNTNAEDCVTAFDVKIHDNGTTLDVFVVLHDSNLNDLTYIKGSITDAGSTITFSSDDVIDGSITTDVNAIHSVAIAKTDNDRLVVAFTEDRTTMGKQYRTVNLIGSDGIGAAPTWSGEAKIFDAFDDGGTNNDDKDEVFVGLEAFSSSFGDRVLVYARTPDATGTTEYDMSVWIYDWAGSSMLEQAADENRTTGSSLTAGWISGIIDDSDKVHIGYRFGTSVIHVKYPTAGGLGSETETTVNSGQNVDTGSVSIDRVNDEVYVFYHVIADTTDYNYRKSATGTISFGSEQTITLDETVTTISTSQEAQGGFIHIIAEEDPTGASSDIDSGLHYAQILVVPYKLDGITNDKSGDVLGSVECHLYRDNGDSTVTFLAYQVSHSSTGVYSFTGIENNNLEYFVVFFKDDSPHVMDVTDHVLQPVLE